MGRGFLLLKTAFFTFGERLAILPVIILFLVVFFLETPAPAFSEEEEVVYNGYSKDGLTYDFYLSTSFTSSLEEELSIDIAYSSEEELSGVNLAQFDINQNVNDTIWEDLAQCESKLNWSINTGNGYYGGLQFSQGAWESVGGVGLPHEASKEEQIERGKALQALRGWGVWGLCAKKLGLN